MRRGKAFGQALERRVEPRRVGQEAGASAGQASRRLGLGLALVEDFRGGGGGAQQRVGVGQAAAFLLECLVLAGVESGGADLLELVLEYAFLALDLALVTVKPAQLAEHVLMACVEPAKRFERLRQRPAAKGVEDFAM